MVVNRTHPWGMCRSSMCVKTLVGPNCLWVASCAPGCTCNGRPFRCPWAALRGRLVTGLSGPRSCMQAGGELNASRGSSWSVVQCVRLEPTLQYCRRSGGVALCGWRPPGLAACGGGDSPNGSSDSDLSVSPQGRCTLPECQVRRRIPLSSTPSRAPAAGRSTPPWNSGSDPSSHEGWGGMGLHPPRPRTPGSSGFSNR